MNPLALTRCTEILRCPVTGRRLSLLTASELDAANGRIARRELLHRDGTPAQRPLTVALGTPDRAEIYRIDAAILSLLPDLALVSADAVHATAITDEKRIVQHFYDTYGWVKAEGEVFNDTAQFTDTRPLARIYQRHCNLRIQQNLAQGRYLLDVASGAIPHPEYLDFSRHYEFRLCVDFSLLALREAQRKLGDAGIYVLGDITCLPLASGAVDSVISLHTVYHVPQAQQATAIAELVRVAKPGGRIIVVYTWRSSPLMRAAFGLRMALGRILRSLRARRQPAENRSPASAAPPSLYFAPHDYGWFKRTVAAPYAARLRVWSAVSMNFQVHFFSDNLAGRIALGVVERFEDWFPHLAGRLGQYPMFVIDNPPDRSSHEGEGGAGQPGGPGSSAASRKGDKFKL